MFKKGIKMTISKATLKTLFILVLCVITTQAVKADVVINDDGPWQAADANMKMFNSTFANLDNLYKPREYEFSDVGVQEARHPVSWQGVQ